jgi:hypothetical protein
MAIGVMSKSLTGTTAAGITLAQALVDAGAVTAEAMAAAGFFTPTAAPTPEPVTLAVEGVVTNNRKTVVVTFNQQVDKDSVTDSTMKITDKTTTVSLADDLKTATLVFAAGSEPGQSAEIELVVNGVKSADKTSEIKDSKVKYTVADVTIPTIVGVEVINAKQIDIITSEPMNFTKTYYQVLNNVKIGDTAVIAKATPDFVKNRISIEFATIKAAGTYTVEVKDLEDFAGYKALAYTQEITILEDTTAPVMINAVANSKDEIEVTFDEAVVTPGTFKVNSKTATATVVANSNNTKYKLTGFGGLDLGAIVQVVISYKGQKDVVGNEVKNESLYTFTVADDTTIPDVTIAVESGNKVVVTFTKSMLKEGTIKLLDKDDKVKKTIAVSSLSFKADSKDTVIELTGAQLGLDNVDPAQYKLNFKDMKDSSIRGNGMPETTLTFDALDTKKPTVADEYLVTAGTKTGDDLGKDDTITFYFSEAMDPDTAKNLSNYVVGGIAFSAMSDVSVNKFADDGKSIVITYKNARNEGRDITVYAIKDAAGNMMETKVVKKIADSAKNIVAVSAESSAKNKVVVVYNTTITSVDPSVIKVQKYDATKNAWGDYAVGIGASIDGTKVTYTLDKDFDTTDTTVFQVVANNENLIKNVYGDTFGNDSLPEHHATLTIADKIRPNIDKVETYTLKVNDKDEVQDNQIKITVSEAVYEAVYGNLKFDLIIKDKDGNTIANDAYSYTDITGSSNAKSEIVITFNADAKLEDGDQEITVQLAFDRYIMDKAGNRITSSDVKKVTVKGKK